MSEWNPQNQTLILIGASGGYCLEDYFLERFDKIIAIDPDPLAQWFFKKKHSKLFASRQKSGVPISQQGAKAFSSNQKNPRDFLRWLKTDQYFAPRDGRFDLRLFQTLLLQNPEACVLFSGFLGQLPFLYPKETEGHPYQEFKKNLASVLEGRVWASFHDRYSGQIKPRVEGAAQSERALDEGEIVKKFYSESNPSSVDLQTSSAPQVHSIELVDHETGDFCKHLSRHYFFWQLRPETYFLIEGVFQK